MNLLKIILVSLILSSNVNAAELLPFPEHERRTIPNSERKALIQFANKMQRLACTSLSEVRDGLRTRVKNSRTSSDRRYYNQRLRIVINVRNQKNCK